MQYTYNQRCEYRKTKKGWVTQCKYRVKPNRCFKFCPYCGKPIIWLSDITKDLEYML